MNNMAKTDAAPKKKTTPRKKTAGAAVPNDAAGDTGPATAAPPVALAASQLDPQLRRRIVVETVHPEVDSGRFPIKRTVGEEVMVSADVFTDGHDKLACALLYRRAGEQRWLELPMSALGNDR